MAKRETRKDTDGRIWIVETPDVETRDVIETIEARVDGRWVLVWQETIEDVHAIGGLPRIVAGTIHPEEGHENVVANQHPGAKRVRLTYEAA